ncbi:MAG: tRNA (adenosine(37)-N6)-threonylcarbamoyltransferase complex transferase subunit TsaD [Candidatus Omnitrophica bacterium]|nr:tRNA (adenosine(37)-N6)-threonylcarbamoyltransferase complex transferase subunit TsaD [Candidatus Omnitrophota bacterium]MBL7210566.1 tRNA (adenosine(37)-N6)-threonylcarbamoyltransferase complex transferase subunit TsaD [Candidatus Omnitrophota bacterium]
MYVLGIETSCDETSVSVVRDGRQVLSNKISSSLKIHKKYGGVVPEIASRMQLESLSEISDASIREAGIKLKKIDLISVTSGPGLAGSLLVGVSFAKALSLVTGKPLIGVNHLHSHIYANFLNAKGVRLPFIALVVSGGHTSLFRVRDFDKIETLGATRDDACGEAFDKVAKILSLGYPGGPFIERLAKKGNPKKIRFNCSGTRQPLDFSFSGIKTAVLYYVKNHLSHRPSCPERSRGTTIDHRLKYDIAASFQESVVDALIDKSLLACRLKKINRLVIGGGVAANNRLRVKFHAAAKERAINYYFPPGELCTDNAAMVAGFAYRLFRKGHRSDLYLDMQLAQ